MTDPLSGSGSGTGTSPRLVLASQSPSRAALLTGAGLAFERAPAGVDEAAAKDSLKAEGATPGQLADTLAELKAARISPRFPGALVLGADQVLACDGEWFDKPPDLAAARAQLLSLRDRTHQLFSAAVILRDGERLWGRTEHATLRMRAFSEEFLDAYLEKVGDRALTSVGAYQLEGPGVQLFSHIEGDFFTILGLPLLALLDFLRGHGALSS